MASFEEAIAKVLQHEGGYSDDPEDPGNWTGGAKGQGELKGTNFGIAASSHPDLDIRNITREQAVEIYKTEYWDVLYGSIKNQQAANALLDFAVTSGKVTAIKAMQRAVGVSDDGIFGLETLAAINNAGAPEAQFFQERARFYLASPLFHLFGKGWLVRALDC